ncbi:hypothetical protein WQ54_15230 [Bacillus sp. SA1-12]|uniref:hypothetical protein n=1 Tax=Bacillus sp. SA1-12 TaxID=1455638 RepID=UPI0006263782|nr:hypothetical protein [Bacillus sp. SA1-12]KKI91374.1 hypothetical protein WQ54_15230 [Bacillus sp. SA1-12]
MLKYGKLLISGLVVGGLLAGCGAEEQSSGSEPKEEPKAAEQESLNKEEVSEPKKDKNGNVELLEVGQKAESEAGTGELLKIKQVNETVDIAPLKVTIQDIKVIKMTDVDPVFAEDLSYMADTDVAELKDGFSYVQVKFTAENTTDGNVEWYDLMNVVTDKGEQIDGQLKDFFVDDSESDSVFIGKVKKEYQDGFVIKDDQINSVKLVFGYTMNGYTMNGDTFEDITGEQTVEYKFE